MPSARRQAYMLCFYHGLDEWLRLPPDHRWGKLVVQQHPVWGHIAIWGALLRHVLHPLTAAARGNLQYSHPQPTTHVPSDTPSAATTTAHWDLYLGDSPTSHWHRALCVTVGYPKNIPLQHAVIQSPSPLFMTVPRGHAPASVLRLIDAYTAQPTAPPQFTSFGIQCDMPPRPYEDAEVDDMPREEADETASSTSSDVSSTLSSSEDT